MTTNTNADWKCGNEFLPYHPGASHVEPAYRDGWNDCYRAALTTAAVPPEGWPLASAADRAMRAQAAPAVTDDTHAFQNFHRALCERFGYTHDARDWRRDQVSLIEHIAKLAAPAAVAGPSEADLVLAAIESGEWEIRRHLPQQCLTDEANRRHAWSVVRGMAPYCTEDGVHRVWTGATPMEALLNGAKALDLTLPVAPTLQPAPVAQGDAEDAARERGLEIAKAAKEVECPICSLRVISNCDSHHGCPMPDIYATAHAKKGGA